MRRIACLLLIVLFGAAWAQDGKPRPPPEPTPLPGDLRK